jgi:hypothetical protein
VHRGRLSSGNSNDGKRPVYKLSFIHLILYVADTLFPTTLNAGDVFLFPGGLIHFQQNTKHDRISKSDCGSEQPKAWNPSKSALIANSIKNAVPLVIN